MVDATEAALTERELQCLRAVSEHKRTKVIATELGLAPKTVDAYIASAARKLGVGDRDSAVRALLDRDPTLWGQSPSAKTGVPDRAAPAPTPSAMDRPRLRWPFPTSGRPTNDFTVSQNFAWIVVLAALMLSGAAIYTLCIRMLAERI